MMGKAHGTLGMDESHSRIGHGKVYFHLLEIRDCRRLGLPENI